MTFTSPFQHKCPECTCDLYEHMQDKLFINAFTTQKFECPKCNTLFNKDQILSINNIPRNKIDKDEQGGK